MAVTGDVTDEADNCSTNLNATFTDAVNSTDPCAIIITRTWHLVDNCLNAAPDQIQTITVRDNTPPTFTCPANITIYSGANCTYDAGVAVTGDVTDEADNCSTNLNATFTDVVNSSDPCAIIITRTWHLVDNCLNAAPDQIQTITVRDNTPPTFTAPANTTIYSGANCTYDAGVAVTGDVTDEADNCSTNLNATFTDVVNSSDPCAIIITRTWHLVDNCLNAAPDQIQTITVRDNTPPTFTAPANTTIYSGANCTYDAGVAVTGDVTDEADNCSTNLNATFTDVVNSSDPCAIIITRTWHLVDNCLNAAPDQIQTITVRDNTPPTFTAPANTTIYSGANCTYDAGVAVTGDVTDEADNCSTNLNATFTDVVNSSDPCAIIITRTWHLVDNCLNAAPDQIQTITVRDNTPPTFTAPANTTIYSGANCTYDAGVAVTGDVTDEADNCSTNLNATFTDVVNSSDPCAIIITRTWHLVDNCLNAAPDQIQTITVRDNTPPTFTAPANTTIYSGANCTYDAGVAVTGDVTDEADNCSTNLNATFTDVVNSSDPCAIIITRTWHLVDNCLNAAPDQIQTITVRDNTPPTFTAPANITIYSGANCTYDAGVAVTGDVTDEADNCSTNLNATFTDVVNSSDPCAIIITRTWHLVDNCLNAAPDQIQTITVRDNTPPTFTAPANTTIYSGANCTYDAGVAVTGDVTDEADNCSTNLNATFTDVVNSSDPCAIIITRTWHLVDNCLNAAPDQIQTITVRDNTPPTFTAPANTTIYSGANCTYDAGVAVTGDVTDEADNCSTNLNATFTDVVNSSDPCAIIITRTWHLVDNCLNAAPDQIQTITVRDNTPPTFTAPANTTIYSGANCTYDAGVAVTGDVTDEADNCSTNLNATFTDVVNSSDPCAIIITRTWHLVDNCLNAAPDQIQTITVRDNTPPTFTAPANTTIYSGANCTYDAGVAVTGDVTDEADNCSTNLNATFTDVVNSSDPCAIIITRTWHLVDNCLNAAPDQIQTITVRDNTPPTFTAPANTTIYSGANCTYDAGVAVTGDVTDEADNCSTNLNATFTDVVNSSDPCAIIITRTWHLVDNCLNAAPDQIQTITVRDNTPPTFTAPANTTIYSGANCTYDAGVAVTGDVTDEADNCSTNLNATFTDVVNSSDPCAIIITRTWHLVDNCLNAAPDQIQTITVRDNTPPTFTAPANTTIYSGANCTYDAGVAVTGDVTDEADNCSTNLNATFTDVVNSSDPCAIIITRTWHLVDNCLNAAPDQIQTITVRDNTPPTFTAPANTTIYSGANCTYDAGVAVTGDVTDEADNCSTNLNATFTDVVNSSDPCAIIITRTWHLVDNCLNAAPDQIQTITVRDNTPPTFTAPANTTIYSGANCTYDAGVAVTGDVTDEADNCSTNLNATFTDVVNSSDPCAIIITRTWHLVDNCLNAAPDQIQTITVRDNTPPTFTAPANTTIYSGANCTYDAGVAVTGDVTDEADNCSTNLNATFTDVVNSSDPCAIIITRTWHLVDNCLNAAPDQIQTITVRDNTPPTFTAPANTTIYSGANCTYDAGVAVTGDVTDEADNCSTNLNATFTDVVNSSDPCAIIITRTWHLVDNCLNAAPDQIQTITVRDNTPPTFTAPANTTIYSGANCTYDAGVAVTGDVTDEADNCSTNLNATFTDVVNSSDPCAIIITRTWHLVDNCLNAAPDQIQTITVRDNTPPTFTAPANTTIYSGANCTYDAGVAVTGDVTDEADNCSTNLNATFTDVVNSSDPCAIIITRTWHLVDNCLNAAPDQIQTITVRDNTPPTFTAPANTTIYSGANCTYDAGVAVTGDVTDEADNCSTNLNATFTDVVNSSDPCAIIITRTWHLVDNCLNAAPDQIQTITVRDNTPPTFTAPANTTIYSGANCTYDAGVAVTGDVTDEADNCSTNLNATFTDVVNSSDPCAIIITRTWHLVDNCLNAAPDQIQTITVRDNTPPTFTAPANTTIYSGANCTYDAGVAVTGDVTDEADNCSTNLNATFTDVVNSSDPCAIIITRTWHLVDNCLNAAPDQIQTITVRDNTPPTFTAPANTTIYSGANCTYDAGVAVTGDVTDEADNCSTNLNATFTDVVNSSDPCAIIITRTWHLVDNCLNAAPDQIQTITVRDNTPPTFTAPANTTIYSGANCTYDAGVAVTGDVTDEADNCSTNLNATFTDVVNSSDPCAIIITRTWHLVDNCLNAAPDQIQTITVRDNTPPTFTAPANTTIYSGANCTYDAGVAVTGDVTDEADNCSTNLNATFTDVVNSSDPCAIIITRTWHLVDNCLNAAPDQIQTITVRDNTPPTFTAPANTTIYSGANCTYDAGVAVTGDVTDEADNCSTNLNATFTDVVNSSDPCAIIITRTWHLVDNCLNAAPDQIQTITVRDNTPPTFTAPANTTIYSGANCTYDAGVAVTGDVTDEADNCSTNLNATFTDVVNSSDPCAIIITRTWHLVDNCLNAAPDQIQTITVRDNTPPTFTAPANTTIYSGANCTYDAGVAVTGDVTDEADNCSTNLNATFTDVVNSSDPCAIIITRTWHLVDNCLNAAPDQIQTITVRDNTPPTFTAPANTTIYSGANCTYDAGVAVTGDVTDEADNCSTNLNATFTDVVNSSDPCAIIITRTWHLVDNCLNAAPDQIQTITVRDNTPPTFTAPANTTIYSGANCTYDAGVAVTGDVTDEADNCSTNLNATFTDVVNSSDPCAIIITRTWHLVDNCLNAAPDQIQTITVRDNTPPTFTAPANTTIYSGANCTYDAGVAVTGDVTDEADNCSTNLNATFTDVVNSSDPCAIIITRTWHLVDNCLNAAPDQIQTITVRDNTPPTFTAPANTTIYSGANCTYDAGVAVTGDVTDEADNCSTNLNATFTDVVNSSDPCAIIITRTWHLVDNCLNAAPDQIQTITVRDNTPPTFTAPANTTIYSGANCTYDAGVAVTGDVTDEADNCSTNLNATFTDVVNSSDPCAIIITRTWHLVDNCLNAAPDQIQTITVRDNTPPTFTAPANTTIYSGANCTYDAGVAVTGDVTDEADNCSTNLNATFTDVVNSSDPCAIIITRTWHLVDNCLNAAPDQIQTITVRDNTPPTFTAPANTTIYSGANCTYDAGVAVTGDVTDEADNCSTNLNATFTDVVNSSDPCAIIITRTWHLVDNCLNAAPDQIQTITVRDNTPPTFTAPANTTIYSGANCTYDAGVAVTGDVTDEADNCSTNLNATFTDVVNSSDPCAIIITRTWHLVDNCLNAAPDQIQTITVRDNTPPTFTAPANTTIYSGANCTYDAGVAVTGDVTDEADNCSTNLNATFTDVVNSSDPCAIIITRTWHLVDNCLNAAPDQIQTITVRDNTPPTFTAPANTTIYSGANCTYDAGVAVTGDVTDEADNCSTNLNATFTDVVNSSDPCAIIITRTWHLVDNCLNAAPDQIQTITVRDNTPPTFTAPANTTIYSGANCTYDAGVAVTGDVTDEADNCSTNLNATFTDVVNSSDPCAIIITRTWHLVDNCLNAAPDQIQTITVRDNTPPTFTAPANTTIYSGANCTYDAGVAVTGDVTDEADNCSTNLNATFTDVVNSSDPCAIIITRTWHLVDNCLNAAPDQIQTITVRDNTPPTFTAPANTTIYSGANCTYDAGVAVTGDVTDEADNCSTNLNATFTDVVNSSDPCAIIITRTWHLVDNCLNAAPDQIQTITVRDNTPPIIISCPPDLSFCEESNNSYTIPLLIATDNCNGSIVIRYQIIGATDRNGTGNDVSGIFNVGISTIEWTVTDACGNISTCSTVITIEARVTPTFTQLGPYCIGATPVILPTTSLNSITGSWDPAIISTVDVGSTNYTFTPTAEICASPAQMTIVVNALPTITGNLNICFVTGASSQLTGSGNPATVNPWTSDNNAVATVDNSGMVTAVADGSAIITYTDINGCSTTATVTVYPEPTITGNLNICFVTGASSQLTGSGNPATVNPWTSDNNAVATVDNSGMVTAVADGSAIITYTDINGCSTTATVTVYPEPTITGNLNICFVTGASSQLTGSGNPATVNPWTSDNNAVATVDNSGMVTAVADGSAIITYTDINGCSTTATVTVYPEPTITGNLNICFVTGASSQLTGSGNPATVNPWTSDNNAVATVDNSGMVTAVADGSAIITYTDINGCSTTATVTVYPEPTITGNLNICFVTGASSQLTGSGNPATVNPWTSDNNAVATVDNSGMVTAVADGSAIITYTDINGCSTTATVTVYPEPTITGNLNICFVTGASSQLTGSGNPATVNPWTSDNNAVATVDNSGMVTAVADGSAIITYTDINGCSTTATVTVYPEPTITGNLNICFVTGASSQLTGSGNPATVNPWTSDNNAVATVDNSGMVTAVADGSAIITYTDINGCSTTATVTVYPEPTITGNLNICFVTGASSQLTGSGNPATVNPWTSDNNAVATVDNSGMVTAVADGSAIITYTDINGCSTTATVTVYPEPTITGNLNICFVTGASSQLTGSGNPATVNPWTSDNNAVATVDNSGMVTAVADGSAIITYTDINGCSTTATVTVYPEPTITGNLNICFVTGASSQLTGSGNPATVNPWTSDNNAVATVDNSGMVTAVADGSAIITYTDINGCSTTATVTVYPEPTITGNLNICFVTGASSQLTGSGNPATVNPWTSDNNAVATVDNSGMVTAVADGSAIITYTDINGCSTTATVTVYPEPTITGNLNICFVTGASSQLTGSGNPATVNPWTSDNNAVATVDNSGMVTAVADGSAIITYTDINGCSTTATVTVYPEPTITGNLNICFVTGASSQLTGSGNPATVNPWTSDNNAVATVDNSGMVTAVADGSAIITYTDINGCSTTATVTVYPEPTITGNLNICFVTGASSQLTGSGNPATVNPWTSDNNAVATVDNSGMVTAVADGSAIITYTDINGCSTTATVTVYPEPTITGNLNICFVTGASSQLTGSGNPATVNPWTSDNNAVATVDNSGMVTAVADGSAIITYTDINGCSTTATVTVYPEPTITASAIPISCNTGTTTITVTASGGTAPFYYSLDGTTFQDANTFDNMAAGDYTITVRDA